MIGPLWGGPGRAGSGAGYRGPMAIVLVVSDDVWVDNDVRASLTDPGTVITSVSDPRAAAKAAEEHSVDVAVVDLQVGSMGGMAVVRALRTAVELDDLHPLRLILLLDRDADKFLAHRAGADVAVVKPFSAQDLRAAIALPAPA
jgi:DNA-binding response OmpR family regulator